MAGTRSKSGPAMRAVAAAAGVSQATVSLALNSDSGSWFAEETQAGPGTRGPPWPTLLSPTPRPIVKAWPE